MASGTAGEMVGALYSLTADDDASDFWGQAEDAAGLFTPLEGGWRSVELLGCAPRGGLLEAAARIGTERARAGDAHLAFLDGSGREIGRYFVNGVTVEKSVPSARGAGLVDLTVGLWCEGLLPQADRFWDHLRSGSLTRKGLWHGLDREGRDAWLSAALKHRVSLPVEDNSAGAVYALDGSNVTDTDGFYCALGEAVNGPGGYFGWNLDAVHDCLGGGWGASPPFTLIWNDSAPARAALGPSLTGGGERWLDVLMAVFQEHAVSVQLR